MGYSLYTHSELGHHETHYDAGHTSVVFVFIQTSMFFNRAGCLTNLVELRVGIWYLFQLCVFEGGKKEEKNTM